MKKLTYEWKIVLLLAVLFGMVGLDRFAIVYLFPVIVPALGLNNTQAGSIASILAFTLAISTWALGGLSDKKGRKGILVFSAVYFSLMTWLTGMVKSWGSMMVVRGLLGIGEGGVYSTSVATIAETVKPEKKGLMLGVHQAFFPLLGIGLGPIIATQLNKWVPWESVFFILCIPGLILAFALWKIMKNVRRPVIKNTGSHSSFSVLKYKNIWVSIAISCCFQTGLFVFSTFVALYLTQVVKLPLSTVGLIISGWGFGGSVGMIVVPWLSDRFGRKFMMILCSAIYAALMLVFAFSSTLNPVGMFLLLGVAGIFGFGLSPLFQALIPVESVPANLSGSAVGLPTCIGEMAGGVVMPVVAGGLADIFGLHIVMVLVGLAFGLISLLSILYTETAPLEKTENAPA